MGNPRKNLQQRRKANKKALRKANLGVVRISNDTKEKPEVRSFAKGIKFKDASQLNPFFSKLKLMREKEE